MLHGLDVGLRVPNRHAPFGEVRIQPGGSSSELVALLEKRAEQRDPNRSRKD